MNPSEFANVRKAIFMGDHVETDKLREFTKAAEEVALMLMRIPEYSLAVDNLLAYHHKAMDAVIARNTLKAAK